MIVVPKLSSVMVSECLEAIALSELPTHSHKCPNCALPVRYPVAIREQDLEDFAKLMASAKIVLEKHGYTGKLIAEIQAQCYIQIAQNNS
jgi:hypothetical protein